MRALIIAAIASLTLSACGVYNKAGTMITDHETEVCHDGTVYIQFLSGVSVKYDAHGNIVHCVKS